MKKMYTASLKNNILLVSAFVISTFTICSVESYFDAKEKANDTFFRTGKKTESNYFAYVANGFTLNQNYWTIFPKTWPIYEQITGILSKHWQMK